MARLARAAGWRGAALGLGAAALAGLVHGTMLWAVPGGLAWALMMPLSAAMLAIGGLASARRGRAAALGQLLAMLAGFAVPRLGVGVALGGAGPGGGTALAELLLLGAAALAGVAIGRERPGTQD